MSMWLKRISIYFIFTVALPGCSNETVHDEAGKSAALQVKNIGHAGSGFNYLVAPFNPYPPNSFSSLKNAMQNGADGVEADLQISADRKLILFHDLTLDDMTPLSGRIPFLPADSVIGLPYTNGFPYEYFHSDEVISLEQWLAYAVTLTPAPYLHLDIKIIEGQNEQSLSLMTEQLGLILYKYRYPLEKVLVISNNEFLLKYIQNTQKSLPVAFESVDFENAMQWALTNQCRNLVFNYKAVSRSQVERARAAGIHIILFGGKSRSTINKMVALAPDFIQSNNVKLLSNIKKQVR